VSATLRHSRPVYSNLDLPHPGRSALLFGVLVVAALALDAAPDLPWTAGVVAAGCFAVAGVARTIHDRRELTGVRRAADRIIVHAPTSRDASELVRWRCAELTSRGSRDRLTREVRTTLHRLDPSLLPSASPLRRPVARRYQPLLEQLASRLGDERAISARGVLLAQALMRDPASPLYADGPDDHLARMLRRVLGALEP
jgi:hypothetical protein